MASSAGKRGKRKIGDVDEVHGRLLTQFPAAVRPTLGPDGLVQSCLRGERVVSGRPHDNAGTVDFALAAACAAHGGVCGTWEALLPPDSRECLLGEAHGREAPSRFMRAFAVQQFSDVCSWEVGVHSFSLPADVVAFAREATRRTLDWKGWAGRSVRIEVAKSRAEALALGDGVPMRVVLARGMTGFDDSDVLRAWFRVAPVLATCGTRENILGLLHLVRSPRVVNACGVGQVEKFAADTELDLRSVLLAHSAALLDRCDARVQFDSSARALDEDDEDISSPLDSASHSHEAEEPPNWPAPVDDDMTLRLAADGQWRRHNAHRFELALASTEPELFAQRAAIECRGTHALPVGEFVVLPGGDDFVTAPEGDALFHRAKNGDVVFSAAEARRFAAAIRRSAVVMRVRALVAAAPFMFTWETVERRDPNASFERRVFAQVQLCTVHAMIWPDEKQE